MAKDKKPAAKPAEASKSAAKSQAPAPEGMPLFFRDPKPVDAERHRAAGIKKSANFTFASETNSIPLNAAEFIEAAKFYPIVFTGDEQALPAVIVGLEKDNYFVDSKGTWREYSYIPAYVRKYPFTFMEITEKQQFVLCVDEAAEHYAEKVAAKDEPFYKDGKPSALTNQALEFCGAFHNHFMGTQAFCQALKDADLLVQNQSDISLANGRKIRLGGFRMIDEKKFNELPEATILEWKKKGWLALVYFTFLSNSNWRRLADMASSRESAKAA